MTNKELTDSEILDFFSFPEKEASSKNLSRLRNLYKSIKGFPSEVQQYIYVDNKDGGVEAIVDGPGSSAEEFSRLISTSLPAAIAKGLDVIVEDRLDPVFPLLDNFIEISLALSKAFEEGRKGENSLNEGVQEDPRFSDELGNVLMKHVKFASQFFQDQATSDFFLKIAEAGVYLKKNKGQLATTFLESIGLDPLLRSRNTRFALEVQAKSGPLTKQEQVLVRNYHANKHGKKRQRRRSRT